MCTYFQILFTTLNLLYILSIILSVKYIKEKERNVKTKYKKNILTILIIIILFSLKLLFFKIKFS